MKSFIVLAVLVAVALARPDDRDALILNQQADISPDGSYSNNVQTSNGIAHSESGQLKQVPGAETQSLSVQGQYEYETKEGEKVRISYIADENGYRAEGPHIPKA